MLKARLAMLMLALAGMTACSGESEPRATVTFALDAPLCSSILPVQLWIDSVVVGRDTFRVNLAPDHTTSAAFSVTAGAHFVGANVVGGYLWPDTLVYLDEDAVFTRILPFYCS